MTPRIRKSLCKKCPHYRGYCPMEDLEPCVMHKELTPLQIFLRIIGIEFGILVVVILVVLLITGCGSYEEPAPEYNWSAVELLRKQHKDELTEWQKLIMAISFTESRWNKDAVGAANDSGHLQIVPIYVAEVNRLYGTDYTIEDAFDIEKSLEMYELMQAAKNPSRDLITAIYYHNKSEAYKQTVLRNLELVRNYELIRSKLK